MNSLSRLTVQNRIGLQNSFCCFSTEASDAFDLVVIGGGPGGLAGAIRGWDLNKKVCLIDAQSVPYTKDIKSTPQIYIPGTKSPSTPSGLGGAALYNGALSSKALWQLSKKHRTIRVAFNNRGLEYEASWPDTYALVHNALHARDQLLSQQIEQLSKPGPEFRPYQPGIKRRSRSGVEGSVSYLGGWAKFLDPHSVLVTTAQGPPLVVKGKHFLIATGSRPRELPQFPVDGKYILTSDHLMNLKDWPQSLAIVGAGVIGCEFATIFSSFERTTVHLLNPKRKRLMPGEDPELSSFIEKNLARVGVVVHNDVELNGLEQDDDKVKVSLGVRRPGSKEYVNGKPFEVERVLVAAGRVPNVERLDLHKAGVQLCSAHGVKVKQRECTAEGAPHIYAAGDCTADIGLVNVAEMEGRHAVETMFLPENQRTTRLSYENISSIMFVRPEVACVGMNEQDARRQKIKHRTAIVGLDVVSRSIITRPQYATDQELFKEGTGYVKMIVTDDENAKLLGMRAVGDDASAIIQSAAMLIGKGGSILDLEMSLQPHPSVTEAVQECVRLLLGRSTFKAHVNPSITLRHFDPNTPSTDESYKLVHEDEIATKNKISYVPTYIESVTE